MSLPEHATRKRLIDKALKRAGWSPLIPFDTASPRQLVVFEEYPTANGPADYALFHHRQPLAIVEAKKLVARGWPAERLTAGAALCPGLYG